MGITNKYYTFPKRKAGMRRWEKSPKNLLKQGLDIHLIHEATSMSIKQLEKLKKESLTD